MLLRTVPFLSLLPLLFSQVNLQEIKGSCKSIVQVKGDDGTLKSPSYPSIGKDERVKCTWMIEVGEGKKINLRFDDFDLQSPSVCGGEKCECSHVIVRDSVNFWKFCNQNKPPADGIVSSDNKLRLQVRKVKKVESRGVKFTYIAISPTTAPPIVQVATPQPTTNTSMPVVIPPKAVTTPLVNIYTKQAQTVHYAPVLSKKSAKKEKDEYKYVVLAPAIPAVLLFVGGVIGIAIYQQRKEEEGDEELERLAPRRRSRVARIKEFFHRKDDEKDSGRDALYDEMLKNWRTNQQDNKQTIWDDYVKARRRSKIRKEIQQYTDQRRSEDALNGNIPAENLPSLSLLSPEENKRAKRVSWHDEAVKVQPAAVKVQPPVEPGPKPKPDPTEKEPPELPSIMVKGASDDEEEEPEKEQLITPERTPVEEAEIVPTFYHRAESAPPDTFEEFPLDEFPPSEPTPLASEPMPSTTEEPPPEEPLEPIDWDAPVQETSLLTEAPYSCSDHLRGIMGDSYDNVSPEDERDWSPRERTPEDDWNPWEYRTPSRRKRQTSTDTSDVDD